LTWFSALDSRYNAVGTCSRPCDSDLSLLGLAKGMVGVGYEFLIVVILLILSIGLQLEARYSAKFHLEDYDDQLEEMKNSLNVVAQVLHKLPELVPQFKIETNPLSQILEFFQSRAAQQETSLGAEPLREDNGQYSDGTTQEQEIT
jgi:hypothetical protein